MLKVSSRFKFPDNSKNNETFENVFNNIFNMGVLLRFSNCFSYIEISIMTQTISRQIKSNTAFVSLNKKGCNFSMMYTYFLTNGPSDQEVLTSLKKSKKLIGHTPTTHVIKLKIVEY